MAECAEHESVQDAYVCSHLLRGDRLGFVFFPDAGNAWPDAWCLACEEIRWKAGGWNEANEQLAQITAVCSGCYEGLRSRNARSASGNDLPLEHAA
jgi:hypothetical protein